MYVVRQQTEVNYRPKLCIFKLSQPDKQNKYTYMVIQYTDAI